tara:strand:+ start:257 stop:367 length:111 start_codon:yes stop_codon:yes gene_type:complete
MIKENYGTIKKKIKMIKEFKPISKVVGNEKIKICIR